MKAHRFVITHLDPASDRGYARHISSPDGGLILTPISFSLSGVSDAFLGESGYGFRIPSQATRNRVPELDDEIVGSIAIAPGHSGNAVDDNGMLTLRNWAYGEQFDAMAMDAMNADGDLDDDGENDHVSADEVYSRALNFYGGNHELAREAVNLYPGDFIG